jgi:hypothetical protein
MSDGCGAAAAGGAHEFVRDQEHDAAAVCREYTQHVDARSQRAVARVYR